MATIAALIVDVAANTASIDRSTKQINTQLDSISSTASTMAKGLAAAFTIGAVQSFAMEILDTADAIQKMSDQTGMSTAEVQKLQFIAGQSSSSVESLVSAAQNLQVKLGSGDAGVTGAVQKLNINLATFTQLGAYDQMTLLADKVRDVKNPTDQAALAASLFGKTWKEILPAIKGGMKEVGDQASIMSDETVKSLDRIGDTLAQAKSITTAWGGSVVLAFEGAGFAVGDFLSKFNPEHFGVSTSQILKMQGALNDPTGLQGALQTAGHAARALAVDGMAPLAKVIAPTGSALADMNRQLDLNMAAMNRDAEAAKKAAKEHKDLADALVKTKEKINDINQSVGKGTWAPSAADMSDSVDAYVKSLNEMADVRDKAFAIESGSAGPVLAVGVQLNMDTAKQALAQLNTMAAGTFSGILSSAVSTLPQTVQKALTGGGGLKGAAQSMMSQVGSGLGEGLFKAGGALNGINNKLTGVFGNAFGLALPGIGAAIGSVIGPVVGKLASKLFGNPEKEVNPIRQAYVDAAGGLAVLNQRAAEAGVTVRAVLDAKNPEAYKKAIDALNEAFRFQDAAMVTLDETTKKYGFTIEELGPALSRQALDKQAQQIYQDFQVLTAAGIDTDTVLRRMGASVQDFVTQSLRTGTEIPAAMRPMLDRMVELGTLTDANGEVITDLGASGVTFSETMTQGFAKIVTVVERLTDAIARGLGLAIENIPQPVVVGAVHWNVDELPGGINDGTMTLDPYPQAAGGDYLISKPTLFLAGEAGPERATFTPQGKGRQTGGSSAQSTDDLRQAFNDLGNRLDQQQRLLPKLLRDAVLLAS
ncbi:hypothetical protein UFOVP1236_43 [uncultured Caudovirales phage]|uniref:Uncharacterized protein n=1 Tax=uncultured Caudovirales phage TaxID=2100421 RepID=A0A6J5R6P4_9CAUD|nr:hypothetical protein UFOVP1236_43 [uncultured Caudovirales phage]